MADYLSGLGQKPAGLAGLGQSAFLPTQQMPVPQMPSNAISRLNLTPQEQYLYRHHLNNLLNKKYVNNPDGSYSSVYQTWVEHNGRAYNIPTVWDGKILRGGQAEKRAAAIGWDKWPSYPTGAEADARYQDMHKYMELDEPPK